MTKEEAIFCEKSYIGETNCVDCKYYGSVGEGEEIPYTEACQSREAHKMAIKALEQEPILDKINKMKSEIAGSLEFWDYSPNNNPLARDILETLTFFLGDIKAESENKA